MGAKTDLTGRRFGRLVVVGEGERNNRNEITWRCKCDCGNEKSIITHYLKSGQTKSCGCYSIDVSTTHGMSDTRFYRIWKNMKQRSTSPKNRDYPEYGGRGVKLHESWHDFIGFYEDMFESYKKHVEEYGEENTSIDRIDVDGNYEPSNCRWATWSIQWFNRRKTSRNKSGHIGVSMYGGTRKWRAHIQVHGKSLYLGSYEDINDAIKARKEAEDKYFNKKDDEK